MEELSPYQLVILSIVATVLAQIIKIIAARLGKPLGHKTVALVVFVVSVVLAGFILVPTLPAYTDPAEFAGAWLSLITLVMTVAFFVYKILLKDVMGKIGLV